MIAKIFLLAFIASFAAQQVDADPAFCPYPEKAKEVVYAEEVHEDAPQFGRTEKVVVIKKPTKEISCINLTAFGAPLSGHTSIASIGVSDDAVSIRLVSDIKQGIDILVEVYTE